MTFPPTSTKPFIIHRSAFIVPYKRILHVISAQKFRPIIPILPIIPSRHTAHRLGILLTCPLKCGKPMKKDTRTAILTKRDLTWAK